MRISTRKLEARFAEAQMTQKDFCERHNIPLPTFKLVLAGKRNPRPGTVGKIARALNCDISDLLQEETP